MRGPPPSVCHPGCQRASRFAAPPDRARLRCAPFASTRSRTGCNGPRTESVDPRPRNGQCAIQLAGPAVNRLTGSSRAPPEFRSSICCAGRVLVHHHNRFAEFDRRWGGCWAAGTRRIVREPATPPSAPSNSGFERNHNLPPDAVGEGMPDGAVQCDTALEEHFPAHGALSFDLGEVIGSDGIDQPGDDVFARVPLLLGKADIRVDERRAGRLELHGGGRRNAMSAMSDTAIPRSP